MGNFRKELTVAGVLTVTVLAMAIGVQQLMSIYDQGDHLLPLLPTHADVAVQPKLKYLDSLKTTFPPDIRRITPSGCSHQSPDWQSIENNNTGVAMDSKAWHDLHLFIPNGSVLWTNQVSATCGNLIKVHASLYGGDIQDKNPRTIRVMRVGYYLGSGAREMWSSPPISLKRYNVPNVKTLTRMVETRWPVTTSFTIGSDWSPGLYVVATVNDQNVIENIAPLIVKGELGASKLLLIHSTLTWATYNSFGGRSAYMGPINAARERSRVISLDRPMIGSGLNHFGRDGIALVQFLESNGIHVDQIADTDLDRNPSIISHYSGIILSGHPEYMTNRIFKSLLAARNNGINIAFLGSNSAYWQVRLESSPIGSDRRIAIYRDPTTDPVTDPTLISIQFDNPRINMMPSLLTGETTAGVHVVGDMSLVNKPSWLNIPDKAQLYGWSPNSEIDSVISNNFSPSNVHLIFSGKFRLVRLPKSSDPTKSVAMHRSYLAQTIWYTTPSGSAVFVAGNNYWACELSYTCSEGNVGDSTRSILQSVTQQVLSLWQTKAIGRTLH